MRDEVPVAIVGAGPVGMTLALCLARWGVPCVVLERSPVPRRVGSRAICQQRDVLDTWDALGAGTLWREGVTWSVGRTYVGDREVRCVRLARLGASPLPAFVTISQSRVEAVLEGLVAKEPTVVVRRGFEVRTLVPDDDGVTLRGDEGELRAAWVVLAAGAHAEALRDAIGVRFEGERHPDRFLICDIKVDLPGLAGERRFWFDPAWNPGRQVLMHAQPDGVFRIDWQVPAEFDLEAARRSGGLDELIRHVVGEQPYELVWASVYRFQSSLADRFVAGLPSALAGSTAASTTSRTWPGSSRRSSGGRLQPRSLGPTTRSGGRPRCTT